MYSNSIIFQYFLINFFNEDIIKYLSREKLKRNGFRLSFDSKYEESIYRAQPEIRKHRIAFRSHYLKSALPDLKFEDKFEDYFYQSGNPIEVQQYHRLIETSKISNILDKKNFHFEEVQMDIYRVAEHINKIEQSLEAKNSNYDYTYYSIPGGVRDHAFLVCAIFDALTGKVLCSLCINSWINKKHFDIAIKDKFQRRSDSPFIDCSIDVQINKNDSNCGLYASISGRAFLELVATKSEESKNIFKKYQSTQDTSIVQSFVKENIMEFLPEFFDKGENNKFLLKSPDQFEDFFMKKRWELSRIDVQKLHERSCKDLSAYLDQDKTQDQSTL